jgi:hypothetical protein
VALRLGEFPTAERLEWHGTTPNTPDWSETSRFVAFTLVLIKTSLTLVLLVSLYLSCSV